MKSSIAIGILTISLLPQVSFSQTRKTYNMKPFEIHVDEKILIDLRSRLKNTRWPDEPENTGWNMGTNLQYMKNLCAYWVEKYDWRKAESKLNSFKQFKVDIAGTTVHFVYEKSKNKNAIPLLLLHGWPDSYFRYHKVIAKLTERFDVIVPSIPGMGFSQGEALPMDNVADIFEELMTQTLGYKKFMVAGGDMGSMISMSLSQRHPESLLGYHVTDIGYPDQTTDFNTLSNQEQAYAGSIQNWFMQHGAFNLIQATKPQSLAFAMADSPAGLAAWIMSFMAGMGIGDDVDNRLGRDEIITNIMIYWVTNTTASSFRIYSLNMQKAPSIKGKNTKVPVAVATEAPIPGGVRLPKEWADRQTMNNVIQFHDMIKAGHFAAWEDPEFYVTDLNEFADKLSR